MLKKSNLRVLEKKLCRGEYLWLYHYLAHLFQMSKKKKPLNHPPPDYPNHLKGMIWKTDYPCI
jgi:hypothetical protein